MPLQPDVRRLRLELALQDARRSPLGHLRQALRGVPVVLPHPAKLPQHRVIRDSCWNKKFPRKVIDPQTFLPSNSQPRVSSALSLTLGPAQKSKGIQGRVRPYHSPFLCNGPIRPSSFLLLFIALPPPRARDDSLRSLLYPDGQVQGSGTEKVSRGRAKALQTCSVKLFRSYLLRDLHCGF